MRSPSPGELATPFDLELLLRDEVPRDGVSLAVDGGEVQLPRHGAELTGEPALPDSQLARYRRAVAAASRTERAAAEAAVAELRSLADEVADPAAHAWVLRRLAGVLWDRGDHEGAVAVARQSAALPGLSPLQQALLRSYAGRLLGDLQRPMEAIEQRRAAAAALADAGGEHPVLAALLAADVATAQRSQGDLGDARKGLEAALAMVQKVAPGSYEEGWTLLQLANTTWLDDDLEATEASARRALAIFQPLGVPSDAPLSYLGILAYDRGDVDRAEQYTLQAIAATSEELRRARYRGNLARIYIERGENERALGLLRELVAFYDERDRPTSAFPHAAILGSLADVERRLGDLAGAARHARAGLQILIDRGVGAGVSAIDLRNSLARVLVEAKRLDQADSVAREALATAQKTAPESGVEADATAELASIALERGDLDRAESLYRRALDLRRAIAPGTRREADWLHRLGTVAARRGKPEATLELDLDAVRVLEGLRGRLGRGVESSAGFTSLFQELYWRPIDSLASSGDFAAAFALSERYRAQAFLGMLARRDLDFSATIPKPLDHERRLLETRYDGLLDRLGTVGKGESRQSLRRELDDVRRRRREVADEIAASAPRLAEVQRPATVDAATAAGLLPSGALLLSYVVGPERTWIFAVPAHGAPLTAVPVDVGSDELGRRVDELRRALSRPSMESGHLRLARARLSALLLQPVARQLEAANRLVLAPDGPLHLVPFAVLPDPAAAGAPLVARLPTSLIASATVFREMAQRAHAEAHALVAFGDPEIAPGGLGVVAREAALRSGAEIGPLPWARREVLDLRAMFGDRAQVFVGPEVSEAQVLESAPKAEYLHFACHAVIDPRLPLESGLVLASSAPGGEEGNGFLQVWEIYQRLHLQADLVTLSACETALGRQVDGEGVLGLTRAFQYAGARTVVSSLWRVADRATEELDAPLLRPFARWNGGERCAAAGPARTAWKPCRRRGDERGGAERPVRPLLLGRLPGLRRLELAAGAAAPASCRDGRRRPAIPSDLFEPRHAPPRRSSESISPARGRLPRYAIRCPLIGWARSRSTRPSEGDESRASILVPRSSRALLLAVAGPGGYAAAALLA